MQIVIDILDEAYEAIKQAALTGRDRNYGYLAIANGKVLPKGHGRLVDMDAVLRRIKEPLTKAEFMIRMSAEKVLEADKEEAEE